MIRFLFFILFLAIICFFVYNAIKYFVEARAKIAKAKVEKIHDDEEKRAEKIIKKIKK